MLILRKNKFAGSVFSLVFSLRSFTRVSTTVHNFGNYKINIQTRFSPEIH